MLFQVLRVPIQLRSRAAGALVEWRTGLLVDWRLEYILLA